MVHDVYCVQVHVDKGMKDGQKISFRGESNQVSIHFVHFQANILPYGKSKAQKLVRS